MSTDVYFIINHLQEMTVAISLCWKYTSAPPIQTSTSAHDSLLLCKELFSLKKIPFINACQLLLMKTNPIDQLRAVWHS